MRLASLVVLLLLVPALAHAGDAAADAPASAAPTEPAIDFTVRALDGGNVTLADHLGKEVVVLAFWATWCGPCLKEMPHLNAMQKELGAKGLRVLHVSVDDAKDEAKVKAIAKRYDLQTTVLLDAERKVVSAYHKRGVPPFTVVIGKDKLIHLKKLGYTEGDEGALRALVDKLLAT